MSTIEAKRREFSRLFHDSHIDLPNLREYFNIYSGLRRHTKGSESYNEIRDQLREVPNYLQISRDINRYRTIYDRAITLENQIVMEEMSSPKWKYKYFEPEKRFHVAGSIIIPKNADNMCLMWSILIALHHCNIESNKNRVSQYRHFIGNYDFSMLYTGGNPTITNDSLKHFENKNNIALFIGRPELKDDEHLKCRTLRCDYNLDYSPSISVKDAANVVYLVLLTKENEDGSLIKHYSAIVKPTHFFQPDNRRGKNKLCIHCGEKFEEISELYMHYDEDCKRKEWLNINDL